MLQFGFNEDELPDGWGAPFSGTGTSAADLHRSRTPDAVVMWVSLALLAMRVGAISVDLLDEEDPQRPFLSASPRYIEAHRPFFGASIFEQRLKREDVIHQGDSPLTIWLGRWIDIVGWMGKVLGGSRSYRAGDDPPRLIRQRPYAAGFIFRRTSRGVSEAKLTTSAPVPPRGGALVGAARTARAAPHMLSLLSTTWPTNLRSTRRGSSPNQPVGAGERGMARCLRARRVGSHSS